MILQVQQVSKGFDGVRGHHPVLSNISFDVGPGEFVCIVGYSGAGKTTLINLLAGLSKPDGGQIHFDNAPIDGPALNRALIFQNYSLLPWLTALGNVELAVAQCRPEANRIEVQDQARRYLEMVKLGHALDRRPAELSGGMRQRVALARGLAMEPKLLLLDEPLSALDALTRAEMQDEFVRIQQQEKRTILMITNDVDEAIVLADRILPLSAGPGATLGEPVRVNIKRPCDRNSLNFDPAYQRVRKEVLHYLLHHGPGRKTAASQKASISGRAAPEPELVITRAEEPA